MKISAPLSNTAKAFFALALMTLCAAAVQAQPDARRETVAITYPLGESVTVKFRGTTRLPRLTGEAKVSRSGRRNTRVELQVENLPRAFELGGVYTTYVLWAISPEGHADNLGEIKRSGSVFVDSKIDVTTPLQSFALLVTAEPHFLVRTPSRMVVLENLPPKKPGEAEVEVVNVQYIGNNSDYFNDRRVPDLADQEFLKTPTTLLGARQAIALARFAGADRDATTELQSAKDQLERAEDAWRLKQPEDVVDREAREAISKAVVAEETAEARKAARKRREEIASSDAAVRKAEESAETANQKIEELREALRREEQARTLAERDALSANQQLRELRSEVTRLREEVQTLRADAEAAKLKAARMEGERAVEQQRVAAEQRAARQREALSSLKTSLARFGTVRETEQGVVLVLPDTVWSGARAAELTAKASASVVDPLAALLANYPELQIHIAAHADNKGELDVVQRLTQDRAEALAGRLVAAGVDSARIRAEGAGSGNPVAANTTPAGRARNRRVEITLAPSADASAAGGLSQN
jgi:outer membrane protein OmpA-like peptidoglycan-associated protein